MQRKGARNTNISHHAWWLYHVINQCGGKASRKTLKILEFSKKLLNALILD